MQIDGETTPMSNEEKRRFEKYKNSFQLNSEVANTLARNKKLSEFYEEALKSFYAPIITANIVVNDVARELKYKDFNELKFSPKDVAEIAKMIYDETISTKIAKQLFEEMANYGKNPTEVVKSKNLMQINDPSKIEPIIDEVISKNPKNVEKYKAGNKKLFGFFVGQVLKATKGKAHPKIVNELMKRRLEEIIN